MTTTLTTETTQTTTEPADLWVIELNLHLPASEWVRVHETWFDYDSMAGCRNPQNKANMGKPMTPRPLVVCSEKAVEKVKGLRGWVTYEEGSMRIRNVESDEVIPFEIFT